MGPATEVEKTYISTIPYREVVVKRDLWHHVQLLRNIFG